jgi:hypothetical protein
MTEDLLDDVDDKLADLGKPVAEFAIRGRVLFRNLVIAPLLVLLGLAIDLGAFWGHAFHHFHIIAIGAALVVMGVTLVVRAWRNRGLRVLVFPEGIVCLGRGDEQALCWDELKRIWRKKNQEHWSRAWYGTLVLRVERLDGRSMEFDDSLPNLENLCSIFYRATLPHLLPQAMATYESGKELDFGKLHVARAGLRYEKEAVRWNDVQEIKFGGDQVAVYKKGKWGRWCQIRLAEIPNAHVFRELLRVAVPVKITGK